jgi:hypothetical protein
MNCPYNWFFLVSPIFNIKHLSLVSFRYLNIKYYWIGLKCVASAPVTQTGAALVESVM